MQETITPSEQPTRQEQQSRAQIFEHLFPGNKYDNLKKFNYANANVLFKLYIVEAGRRDIRLIDAIHNNQEFAERENIPTPDKLTLGYYISNLEISDNATHPTLFQGHSFSDLVNSQEGEKLGGAARRKISPHQPLVTKLAVKLGDNPYLITEEIIIGILDKENKPCGLIHFIEGKNPRKRKQAKVAKSRQAMLGNSLSPVNE